MLKIAIIGYGQMGKLIEKLAPEHNCEVIARIDPVLNNIISVESISKADVCIEFTTPNQALENIKNISQLKKNIVVGTTGWFDQLEEAEKYITENNTGLIYGANFSVGMNLFFKIIEHTSKLMNSTEYDPYGIEMHHNKKKDSPSGTAKIISEILLKNIDEKEVAQFEKLDRKIEPNEFHFTSVRAGNIPGEHIIGFDSDADTIELKHTARNRNGLAIGAIKAAHWIHNKKGFYNFQNVLDQILG